LTNWRLRHNLEFTLRKFKVTVVARTSVRLQPAMRTKVRATLKKLPNA